MALPKFGMQKKMSRPMPLDDRDTITVVKRSPHDGTILVGTTKGLFCYTYDWIKKSDDIYTIIDADENPRWNVLDLEFVDFTFGEQRKQMILISHDNKIKWLERLGKGKYQQYKADISMSLTSPKSIAISRFLNFN